MGPAQFLRAEAIDLTQKCLAGGLGAPGYFHRLLQFFLSNTVLAPSVPLFLVRGPEDSFYIGGGPDVDRLRSALPLKNGAFLRLSITLYVDRTSGWLKVRASSVQYQLDEHGDRWVFRYDYLRDPLNRYPPAHLQVRGSLRESVLPPNMPLQRLHFPTGRVTVEAIIRLLVESFGVRCDDWNETWAPILAETERLFLEKAHHPLSGPAE